MNLVEEKQYWLKEHPNANIYIYISDSFHFFFCRGVSFISLDIHSVQFLFHLIRTNYKVCFLDGVRAGANKWLCYFFQVHLSNLGPGAFHENTKNYRRYSPRRRSKPKIILLQLQIYRKMQRNRLNHKWSGSYKQRNTSRNQ